MTKKEVRCPKCNRKLCDADIIGKIEAICPRCREKYVFKDKVE